MKALSLSRVCVTRRLAVLPPIALTTTRTAINPGAPGSKSNLKDFIKSHNPSTNPSIRDKEPEMQGPYSKQPFQATTSFGTGTTTHTGTSTTTGGPVGSETIHNFTVLDANGNQMRMQDLMAKATLIVNVDCKVGGMANNECDELQRMYMQHKNKGLQIVAFPSGQFHVLGGLDPSAAQVKEDLERRYNVTFPVMDKVNVNGENAHPLFMFLQKKLGGFVTDAIKWDFTVFLCVDGQPRRRYGPLTMVSTIESEVLSVLQGGDSGGSFQSTGMGTGTGMGMGMGTGTSTSTGADFTKRGVDDSFGSHGSVFTRESDIGGQGVPNVSFAEIGKPKKTHGTGPFPGTPSPKDDESDKFKQ